MGAVAGHFGVSRHLDGSVRNGSVGYPGCGLRYETGRTTALSFEYRRVQRLSHIRIISIRGKSGVGVLAHGTVLDCADRGESHSLQPYISLSIQYGRIMRGFGTRSQGRPSMSWSPLNNMSAKKLKALYQFIRYLGLAARPLQPMCCLIMNPPFLFA